MSRYRRQAKRILKRYGKAEYRARLDYIKGFLPEEPSYVGRISFRHLGKRCLVIALILTLTMSMAVVAASAFGIRLFGFNLFEYDDHTEITRNEEVMPEGEARFYEPTYVPEGYELISEDGFEGQDKWFVYQNEEGEYLYINQSVSDSFIANINNENCEIRKEIIDDMEEEGMMYILEKNGTYVDVSGSINALEFEKIIYGLD